MDHALRLHNRLEYFQELTAFARTARKGDRITIASMSFDVSAQSRPVAVLMQELAGAASRGAQVVLWVDAYAFLVERNIPGPLWYGSKLSAHLLPPYGRRFELLEDFRRHGGVYILSNKPARPFTYPKAGRSHIKFAVLNDRVFIGGNNLEHPEQVDVMASWHSKTTADFLCEFAKDVVVTGSPLTVLRGHDLRKPLDSKSALLIDAGIPHQSLILDEAYKLIDEAQAHLTMTCQFFPGGRTGQHLAAAVKRGVKVTLYYSPARTHGLESPGHYFYEKREAARLPAELFTHRLPAGLPKLHAKLLVSEKAALIGSHNYVVQGVFLGTAEMALLSRDPSFGQSLETKIRQLLDGADRTR